MLDGPDLWDVGVDAPWLIDRVYVAVRAADWSTIPGETSDLQVRGEAGTFDVSFRRLHQRGELALEWRGTIAGTADGWIRYTMDAEALTGFSYCRIGICVLLPDHLAGASYRARTMAGPVAGSLPQRIAPQVLAGGTVLPPLPHFAALSVEHPAHQRLEIETEGEPFELEDQRNWTDASFKAYVPPIRAGYPFSATPGQRFRQAVRVRVSGPLRSRASQADVVSMTLERSRRARLPRVGVCLDSDERTVPSGFESLRATDPDHLRVDVTAASLTLRGGPPVPTEAARALGCPLQVAVHVPDAEELDLAALERLATRLADRPVTRWLLLGQGKHPGIASESLVRRASEVLVRTAPGSEIGAGTAGDFVLLNRHRPVYPEAVALAYSITSSAHAIDDRSVMENVTAQGMTVETARSFAPEKALWVGPVEIARGGDPRTTTALGTAWLVGSLASLVPAGPDQITYVTGADPERHRLEHAVLRWLADMRHGRPLDLRSRRPREVAGVASEVDEAVVGMLANLTPHPRAVHISPLGSVARASNIVGDAVDPTPMAHGVRLELPPYAVVTFSAARA